MKKYLYFLPILVFLFTACNDNELEDIIGGFLPQSPLEADIILDDEFDDIFVSDSQMYNGDDFWSSDDFDHLWEFNESTLDFMDMELGLDAINDLIPIEHGIDDQIPD